MCALMTEKPQDTSAQLSEETAAQLMRSLLQKEGNWVEWGPILLG